MFDTREETVMSGIVGVMAAVATALMLQPTDVGDPVATVGGYFLAVVGALVLGLACFLLVGFGLDRGL